MSHYSIGNCDLEAESRSLTLQLRSSDPHDAADTLRNRLEEDGYLLVRGLHDRSAVLEIRSEILRRLSLRGMLDASRPIEEGVMVATSQLTTSVRGNEDLKPESLRLLLDGPAIHAFFSKLLGGPTASLRFQWLRTAGPGASSTVHCDSVYMGRGTRNLLTCWTPIGDISPDMGPIVLCLGSHRFESIQSTYGQCDVDRDLIQGYFTDNPLELVDRFGGRWATDSFRAGDALIFGMHLLHASLTNQSNRVRISCDTRYQLSSEAMDPRWSGDPPARHDRFWDPAIPKEPLSVSRKRWGFE